MAGPLEPFCEFDVLLVMVFRVGLRQIFHDLFRADQTDKLHVAPFRFPDRVNYGAAEAVAAATLPSSARPFSNCGPHILSQSMNRLTALAMKLFLPYIA